MHKHRNFRHGRRMYRPWRPFGGFFWLFLLAFFLLGGRWWPGILVLIGLSLLFGSLFRGEPEPWTRDQPPAEVPMRTPAPVAPVVTSPPVEPIHRTDWLPVDCPQCGGPVRSQEVRWTGKQSAVCAWCGSNLPMKKG